MEVLFLALNGVLEMPKSPMGDCLEYRLWFSVLSLLFDTIFS